MSLGIEGSLIAAMIYGTVNKIFEGFRDPLYSALSDTDLYVHDNFFHVFPKDAFKNILSGQVDVEQLKNGNRFIDGDALADQFAQLGGFDTHRENDYQSMSQQIVGHFIERFNFHLSKDEKKYRLYILKHIKHFGQNHTSEHKYIIELLKEVLKRLPPSTDEKSTEEIQSYWLKWEEEIGAALSQRELDGHGPYRTSEHPLNNAWNEFIGMPPWIKEVREKVNKLRQAIYNLNDQEVTEILNSRLGAVDLSVGDITIHEKIAEALDISVVNKIIGLLDQKKKIPGASDDDDREWKANQMKKALNAVCAIIQDPAFRRCFLVLGSFGAGKTHFIASLLAGSDEIGVNRRCLLLPLTPPDNHKPLDELILHTVKQATNTNWDSLQNLDDFMEQLDNIPIPIKLIVTIDGLETWLEKDKDFLSKLEKLITENSRKRYLHWLITLHDTSFCDVVGRKDFFRNFGWLHTRKDDETKSSQVYPSFLGWISLDDMNKITSTGIKILQNQSEIDSRFLQINLNSFDYNKSFFNLVTHPFIAWIIVDFCKNKQLKSLINLKYYDFIYLFYESRLMKIKANDDTKTQLENAVQFIAETIVGYSVLSFNFIQLVGIIVNTACDQSELQDKEIAISSLERMNKMNLLEISHNYDHSSIPAKRVKRIKISTLIFWECRLAEELYGKYFTEASNIVLDEIEGYLETWFKVISNDQVKSGVLEFLLMKIGSDFRKKSLCISKDMWILTISNPVFPTETAWLAAAKSSRDIQESLLHWAYDKQYSPQTPRTLFAYMHFISGADVGTISKDILFRLLQINHPKIIVAQLQEYDLYVAEKLLSSVVDNAVLLECMFKMHGCEKLDIAENMARSTVSRLFENAADIENTVKTILQYLDKLWKNAKPHKETINEKKVWRRYYFREWVLHTFLSGLLNRLGPAKTFELLDENNWFTPDQIGIKEKTIPREMEREASIAFGFWYRQRSKKQFSYNDEYEGDEDNDDNETKDEYLKLIEHLTYSDKIYLQRVAFFLIYHTAPTKKTQKVEVAKTFHPLLKELMRVDTLEWIKEKYSIFLYFNKIEEGSGKSNNMGIREGERRTF